MHAFYFIKYVYLTIYQSNQTSQLALFMHYLFLEKYIITIFFVFGGIYHSYKAWQYYI